MPTGSDRGPVSAESTSARGPLAGLRVLEIAGIGPGPFCAHLFADLGADVIRVDRADSATDAKAARLDVMNRGRRSIAVDLKRPEGVEAVLRLAACADVLFEGFRPGVVERLGIGPDACLARNPRLVYGRMTGYGQSGPMASAAGHDINYISLAGALHHIGRKDAPPTPPLNLVGDFGGGSMYLSFGLLCALIESARSGVGQVVDASMVDGVASLMTTFYGVHPYVLGERGTNILDSGAPFYDVYECSDGRYVSIGAIEPQFFAELLARLAIAPAEVGPQLEQANWPRMRELFSSRFITRSMREWCSVFEGSDACFAPVLTLEEATRDPHNVHRGTFVEFEGIVQPAPAPRFSRTPGAIQRPAAIPGEHTAEILREWLGADSVEIERLVTASAVRLACPDEAFTWSP